MDLAGGCVVSAVGSRPVRLVDLASRMVRLVVVASRIVRLEDQASRIVRLVVVASRIVRLEDQASRIVRLDVDASRIVPLDERACRNVRLDERIRVRAVSEPFSETCRTAAEKFSIAYRIFFPS